MPKLEKIRERFSEIHEKFDDFLAEHKEAARTVIEVVEAGYKAMSGEEKLEMAIALLLEQLHVPGPFAVMASQQIVERTEAFIQKVFNNSPLAHETAN